MNSGSSSPSGSTTTTQNTTPWSGQIPFLSGSTTGGGAGLSSDFPSGATIPGTNGLAASGAAGSDAIPGVLPSAAALYSNYTPSYYPGTTYSPETAAQSSAITGQENLGLNGSPITGAANSASQNILGSNYASSNPGNAAYNDILNGGANVQSAISNVLPGLMDSFTGGNRTESPSAAYGVGQGVGNAVGGLELQAGQGLSNNYQNAGTQQNLAISNAPATQNMGYTDLNNAYNAGTAQQGLGQNTINDAVTKYNYNQSLPYNMLNSYASAVQGNYGGTSTTNTPYYTQSSNTLGSALTGATGLLGLNGLTGSAGGGFSSTLLGGLLSSDRRLKKEIRRIGTHPRLGLPIYEFRYIWGGPLRVGVMAQDALRVVPKAVFRVGEYLAVDYGQIWEAA